MITRTYTLDDHFPNNVNEKFTRNQVEKFLASSNRYNAFFMELDKVGVADDFCSAAKNFHSNKALHNFLLRCEYGDFNNPIAAGFTWGKSDKGVHFWKKANNLINWDNLKE